MGRRNFFQEMTAIWERLLDEESKKVFEARIAYMLDDSEDNYQDRMGEIYDDWKILEVKERLNGGQEIVLFGCGHDGRQAYRLLKSVGMKIAYFCDNHHYGETIEGKKVLSVDEVVKEHGDALVIIVSSKYGEAMYIQLVQSGFSYQNILLPQYKKVLAIRGKQYFDVFGPQQNEIYIDAGTFDGGTIVDFYNWTKGNYQKIYAFEPVKDMCKCISEKMEEAGFKNIQLLNNAVWDRKETLNFSENGVGSRIQSNGGIL